MNKKTKRVGNANLYIGLPYHKRKSYARDSHGFEPLDEYFSRDIERDTSPETDVEELIRQERAKRKAAEKDEATRKRALEDEDDNRSTAWQDVARTQVIHPAAPIQKPFIIADSSDSESDGAEQLEFLRKLAGLATARNQKAQPPLRAPVTVSAPSVTVVTSAAQRDYKAPVQTTQNGESKNELIEHISDGIDKHEPEKLTVQEEEEGTLSVAATEFEMSTPHVSRETANKVLRQRRPLVIASEVGEEKSSSETEQSKPRGRPRKTAGSEPGNVAKQNSESLQSSREQEIDVDTTPEARTTQHSPSKGLRQRKSLMSTNEVGEEKSSSETEQSRPRGRPRKTAGSEPGNVAKQHSESLQSSREQEIDVDTTPEARTTQHSPSKGLRQRKSLMSTNEVGEEKSSSETEQSRPRGRPRKTAGSEPGNVAKQNSGNLQRSHEQEIDVDTTPEARTTEHSPSKGLRQRKSLMSTNEVGEEKSSSETEQSRPRGRPRKVICEEPDNVSKQSSESLHVSQQKEVTVAAGSEGEVTRNSPKKELRQKKSLMSDSEVAYESGISQMEHGRSRGRSATEDGPNTLSKQSTVSVHGTQQKEGKTIPRGRQSNTIVEDNEASKTFSRTYTLPLKPSSSAEKKNIEQSRCSVTKRKDVSQHQESGEKRQARGSAPSDMWFVPQDASTLEKRLRNKSKEVEEEEAEQQVEEEEEEDEGVTSELRGDSQMNVEDDQGDMAEEDYENEVDDSDEEESDKGQDGTISRRLFESPRELKQPDKGKNSSTLASGSEHRTAGSTLTESQSAQPLARKRKKMKSVIPPALKRLKKAAAVEINDSNLLNVTNIGGKKYHRVAIKPKEAFTPGVRRGHRTRVPRLEPDEVVEYDQWFDPTTLTGPSVTGVLIPAEKTPKPKQKRATTDQEMTDDAFPPVPLHDDSGKVVEEQKIVFTPASAEKLNSVGQPEQESPDGVRITKFFSGDITSNGLITFEGLAEKSKCKASRYDLFFYVVKGKVLVNVNSVQYTLHPRLQIHIPQGALYSVQNLLPTVAELYYYISRVVLNNTTGE